MHKCLTYFLISSEKTFNAEKLIEILALDKRIIGKVTEKSIEIGRCETYDVNINNMIRSSIKALLGKEDTLLELKAKYNLTFYLAKVINLDNSCNEPMPILGLEADVIEFLYKTKTIDDLDYYL